METQWKVEIKPSYEWSEKAKELGVSHRELEVLGLLVEGYRNKEIAQILKIQHQSVKNHLQHLLKKLNVRNSTQAYVIALDLNLIRMKGGYVGGKGAGGPMEITAEEQIAVLRQIVSGEVQVKEFGDKKRRQWLKVFLKEHGIEPYDWGEEKGEEK